MIGYVFAGMMTVDESDTFGWRVPFYCQSGMLVVFCVASAFVPQSQFDLPHALGTRSPGRSPRHPSPHGTSTRHSPRGATSPAEIVMLERLREESNDGGAATEAADAGAGAGADAVDAATDGRRHATFADPAVTASAPTTESVDASASSESAAAMPPITIVPPSQRKGHRRSGSGEPLMVAPPLTLPAREGDVAVAEGGRSEGSEGAVGALGGARGGEEGRPPPPSSSVAPEAPSQLAAAVAATTVAGGAAPSATPRSAIESMLSTARSSLSSFFSDTARSLFGGDGEGSEEGDGGTDAPPLTPTVAGPDVLDALAHLMARVPHGTQVELSVAQGRERLDAGGVLLLQMALSDSDDAAPRAGVGAESSRGAPVRDTHESVTVGSIVPPPEGRPSMGTRRAVGALLRNRVYMAVVMALSAFFFVVTGIQFWVTSYLTDVLGSMPVC